MMEFEADRMRNLILTDEVIGPERDVILEERRSRIENSPDALLGEEVDATLYQNHPYRIPVIGWMQEMEKLNRTDAVAFYDRYYAPEQRHAGGGRRRRCRTTVRRWPRRPMARCARGPDLPPRIRPSEPEQNTKRTVSLTDPRVIVPSFSRIWLVPSYHTAKPGEAEALDLLSEILGGGARSRIYQALVVKAGIASSAGAYSDGTQARSDQFHRLWRAARRRQARAVEAAVDAEIAQHRQGWRHRQGTGEREEPFPALDDLRPRQPVLHGQSSTARRWPPAAPSRTSQEWPDRIRKVTADEIKAVAAEISRPRPFGDRLSPAA